MEVGERGVCEGKCKCGEWWRENGGRTEGQKNKIKLRGNSMCGIIEGNIYRDGLMVRDCREPRVLNFEKRLKESLGRGGEELAGSNDFFVRISLLD